MEKYTPLSNNCDGLAEKRAKLTANLIRVADNDGLPVESRNAALDSLTPEVEPDGQVEKRERAEAAEVEKRELNERAVRVVVGTPEQRAAAEGPEWANLLPTAREYRALIAEATPSQGGYSVPLVVANQWVEKVRTKSVFLSAPGIRIVPFDSASFRIAAQLSSAAPSVVAEGATIPKADMTFGSLDFNAIKFGDIYQASSEILEDSALPLESLIADSAIKDMAAKIDLDAFQGAGGTAGLAGISSTAANNTATTLATGKTTVSWDDVLDAYIAILTTGCTPTVVWCSMDQYKALLKSRENTGGAGTGGYLAGSVSTDPTSKAWGLPILPSANLPVRTVIVADASRVFIGRRRDVIVHRSDEYGYGEDVVSWRATSRWAGIRVAEATSVQKIVASAT